MITITDHCDPESFSPLELEGVICYTRLFLEAVFRNSHESVIVNIHIKEKRDALFKDTGGFTDAKAKGYFDIVLFKDSRKVMLTVLSHELIHVKQFMEDGFKIDRVNNAIYWEEQFYMPLSDLVKMHKEKKIDVYAMLPWEHDANLSIMAVTDLVTERLVILCQNDPALKEYLQLALTESSYCAA